nr:MAG TPA: hypothetical protein [Caudoviricetes sp.]
MTASVDKKNANYRYILYMSTMSTKNTIKI